MNAAGLDVSRGKSMAAVFCPFNTELREHTPEDTICYQLKMLNRQCGLYTYTKTRTMMTNNLIALLDQTCPGVNALFDSPVREDGCQNGWILPRPSGTQTVFGV